MSKSDLLLIGPFPPPVSGFSVITEAFCKEVAERLPVTSLNAAVDQRYPAPLYHLLRLLRCLAGCVRIILWHLSGGRALYVACNGGIGILYSALLMRAARILKGSVYLHHHSFEYILDDSPHMRRLLKWAPKGVVHIFLCETMRDQFFDRFGPGESLVLENSAFVPVPDIDLDTPFPPKSSPADLVIGLVSNLNREKGLYSYLDLLRTARAEGLPVRGLLAGPAKGADLAAIEDAVADSAMGLTYLGGVYGDSKDRFFRDIDLFYFPTEYRTEAQPTVIFEAQSYGVSVISRGMGCVTCQLPENKGLIRTDEDTLPQALNWLRQFSQAEHHQAYRRESREFFESSRNRAMVVMDALAQEIRAS